MSVMVNTFLCIIYIVTSQTLLLCQRFTKSLTVLYSEIIVVDHCSSCYIYLQSNLTV